MARKVKMKTAPDGGKYKVIYDDGEPSFFEQQIVAVGKDMLKVRSRKGNEYWVQMSDKVALTMNPEPMDIAVIGTFKEKWVVKDIIKYNPSVEEVLSEEEERRELERELKEFEALGGGY